MSKGNKRNQSERELEAEAKQALRTLLYIQGALKRNLHTEFYTSLKAISGEAVRNILCAMKHALYRLRIKFLVF
jgi:hypothetical protein